MDEWSPHEPDPLPEELIQLVKPELQPGERLLWAASALAGFGPYRQQLLSIEPFLLSFGVIAMIVGLISGVVTIYASADRWWEHGQHVSNTYALTNRRAIIWIPQKGSKAVEVHSFARGSIKGIHRLEYPDGSGSVRFNYPTEDYYGPATGFDSVADVRFVEDLTRRTLVDPETRASI
jgi:hypothetical protein